MRYMSSNSVHDRKAGGGAGGQTGGRERQVSEGCVCAAELDLSACCSLLLTAENEWTNAPT